MDKTYCMQCMRPNGGTAVCPHCGHVSGEKPQAAHVLRAGTILKDQYLLGEPLGQGGFGITYIARDLNLDIRVAVKEYFPNGYANRNIGFSDSITITDERLHLDIQKGKNSFLREARALAHFRGTPGIVDVLNFFEANGTAYIVMEFLEGETLASRLKRQLFTADEIFRLMDPVFDTLEKIHREGVVHRDISPDNIMMLPDGSLKLMDFGAARLMNYSDQHSVSIMLKAGYAPKEQYSSKGKQGPWTDIYALCATIYKCITGNTPDDALDRADGDGLKWPSELGYAISARQESVLKQGMAVSQSGRFQSIGALKTALRESIESPQDDPTVPIYGPKDPETVFISPKPPKKTFEKQNKTQPPRPDSEEKNTAGSRSAGGRKLISLLAVCAVLGLAVIVLSFILLLNGRDKRRIEAEATVFPTVSQAAAEKEEPVLPVTAEPMLMSTPPSTLTTTPTVTLAPIPTLTPTPKPASTPIPAFYDVAVGDEIQFGRYEQDNNYSNGSEPITWIVLERQNGKILVLSKYALDSKAYHEYEGDRPNITWEQCSLRKWLNEQFYSAAFTAEERDLIVEGVVSADRTPQYYDVDPGNNVKNRIFLLSASEANRYFSGNAARLCWPTNYALANGADTKDTPGNCWWWLRSPGKSQTSAAIVSKRDGNITTNYIGISNVGIRPAMWLQV